MAASAHNPREDVRLWLEDLGDEDAERFVSTMEEDSLLRLISEFDAALATYPAGTLLKGRALELYGHAESELDIRRMQPWD